MSTFNAGAIEASLTLDRSSWNRDLKELQAQFQELEQKTITIGIDVDTDNARVGMDNIELLLDDLDQQTYTPSVDLDAEKFYAAAAEVEKYIDYFNTANPEVALGLDASAFHRGAAQVELVEDAMKAPIEINVGMDSSEFHRGAAQVEVVTDIMKSQDIAINVETNGLPKTMAELAELDAAIGIVNAHDVEVDVKYDKNNLEQLVGSASGGGGGGGYMGLLHILILGAIALSPILGVAISALSAYLVAFTGALVGALGPALLLGGAIAYLIAQYAKAKKAGTPLTHGMQELSDAIDHLKNVLKDLIDSKLGDQLFGTMAGFVDIAAEAIKSFKPILYSVAGLFDDVQKSLKGFIGSPEWKTWMNWFAGDGVQFLGDFLSIGGNLIRFLMNLFVAISPFSKSIMKGLRGDFSDLAEWSTHLGKNKGFQDWIKKAQHYGPMLIELLGDIIGAFLHVGDAIEPFAEPMIKGLDAIADAIQRIPVDTLTKIIGFGALFYAGWKFVLPLVSGLASAVETLGAAFAADSIAFGIALGPLLLIIAAIAGLAAMIYYLWTKNEQFRKSLTDAWNDIKKTVMPIIDDIVALFKEKWPEIQAVAAEVWGEVKDIFVQAAGIIQQIVFFATKAISFIWKHFGDQLMRILRASLDIIIGVVKGAFQILDGLFRLVNDLLHGRWNKLWGDIKLIAKGAWTIILALVRGSFNTLAAIFTIALRALVGLVGKAWDGIKNAWKAGVAWVKSFTGSWIQWLSGIPAKIGHALSGAWDGLLSGFKTVVNAIVDFWNSLHFHIPGFDPPGPGPKFGGMDIGVTQLPHLASGGWIDKPTVAMIGEGTEPEIVSPESKMIEIVAKHSNKMDYSKMAAALAAVLEPIFGNMLTRDHIEAILEKAGPNINVDAQSDDRSVDALMRALGFQMRVLGYQGATAS